MNNNSGKRLGIAMLTVVLALTLNTFAVLSGSADGAYGFLFGFQPAPQLAATAAQATMAEPVLSAAGCAPSSPKLTYPPGLVPVTGTHVEPASAALMC